MKLTELAIAQAGATRDLHTDPRAQIPMAPISPGWDRRLLAASEELSGEALGKYGIVMIDAGAGARIRVWSTDRVAARAAMPDYWRGYPVDVTGSGVIRPQMAQTGRVGPANLPGVQAALMDWIRERYGQHPDWLTGGIGIGGTPPRGDRLIVGVLTEADRAKIPPMFYGVPVETRAIGRIYAQPTRLTPADGPADGASGVNPDGRLYGPEFERLAPLAQQALEHSGHQSTVFLADDRSYEASYEKVTDPSSRSFGRTILVIRLAQSQAETRLTPAGGPAGAAQVQAQGQGLPLAQPLPRCPAPFGNTPGHIGGSYDWWWCSFGRAAGMAYDPPATQATVAGRGVKVTLGPRGVASR